MPRPMTPRGYWILKEELKRLKAERPVIAQAIEAARAHGDLSENADYDAAKNKSGLTEARIRDVEAGLAEAQIIDPRSNPRPGRVAFGSTVKIRDLDSGEEKTVSIYGREESDAAKGWISFEAPLARALIGKVVGDTATLTLPAGRREYEVLEISVQYDWETPPEESLAE